LTTAEQTLEASIILNVISIEHWRVHQKACGPRFIPEVAPLQIANVWLNNPVEGQALSYTSHPWDRDGFINYGKGIMFTLF
jgi:hypothetical protein